MGAAVAPLGDGRGQLGLGAPARPRVSRGKGTARGKAAKVGRWTHLAFTYDGRTIRRYVDGRLAGTKRGGAGSEERHRRAARHGGFRGRIDELRVYDRALPAAQLQR